MKNSINIEKLLSPWGMKSSLSRGRKFPEQPHPYRLAFQRDRERILHCSAFRRLEYKTQVFVYHEGDYYRTRLTHSLEVAQIARSISRALNINEDLSEAIAIAHDLGHPPFGHSGEKVLDELMEPFGGFEHNCQSLRIVDHIEHRYPAYRGLNLTYEVREGMAKHLTDYDHPEKSEFSSENQPTLEAQVVDLSDSIAYNSHDLDDGITSGLLDFESLKKIEIWKIIGEEIDAGGQEHSLTIRKNQMVKALINRQVSDLLETTEKNIQKNKVSSVEEVRRCPEKVVSFSGNMMALDSELKLFLRKNMYKHQRVVRMEEKAALVIRDLFKAFTRNPKLLP
ncbi:MAG: deoxyguanosinetriphosphate triphosphohydrolase, partial [Nitrospinota bacterium]